MRRVEKIETAVEPRFQEHFVDAMAIPHDADPYPRLAAHGAAAARRTDRDATGGRRRRPAPREEGGDMSETVEDAEPAGAPPGRQPRAARASSSSVPFLTRTMTPFEVLSDEGLSS